MKGRDVLILAAVVLIGGFALADSLRSGDSPEPSREAGPTTTEPPTTSTAEAPELGRESFPEVNGAGGSIVLAQAGSCAVREFDLPTGLEFPNVVARSTCQLWAAPVTAKVAVGIGEPVGDAVPFRFINLSHPGRDLGTSEAAFGFLVWSEDGQRAAWCNRRLEGIDFEVGFAKKQLPECPAAYTPEGEVAFAIGARLVVEGRPTVTASGGITKVHYGQDGSVGLVVEGRRLERYARGRLTNALDLPERFQGRPPIFSPDNCSALFRAGERMRYFDLGCSAFGLGGSLWPGHTAAWSPDGTWLALGGSTELTFYELDGDEEVTWPIGAVQITWRRS